MAEKIINQNININSPTLAKFETKEKHDSDFETLRLQAEIIDEIVVMLEMNKETKEQHISDINRLERSITSLDDGKENKVDHNIDMREKQDKLIAGNNITIDADGKTINANITGDGISLIDLHNDCRFYVYDELKEKLNEPTIIKGMLEIIEEAETLDIGIKTLEETKENTMSHSFDILNINKNKQNKMVLEEEIKDINSTEYIWENFDSTKFYLFTIELETTSNTCVHMGTIFRPTIPEGRPIYSTVISTMCEENIMELVPVHFIGLNKKFWINNLSDKIKIKRIFAYSFTN